MYLGSHVSYAQEGLLGCVKQALSYGANTFMFYTGAPQNTLRSVIDPNNIVAAHKLMEENKIEIDKVICHAPYIINLANKNEESKWQFSLNFLKSEISRCKQTGIKYLVLHPGSAVGISKAEGLNNIVEALNILNNEKECTILLETMAGKGSECGSSLEEIKYILANVDSANLGVCLDTCHLNDAGYDLQNFDDFLDEFDKLIGLERIKCVHINDSKNIVFSHKDRHANVGYGQLGFNTLIDIIYNARLKDVPKILETPYVGENDEDKNRLYPPYKFEIEMIKKKTFNHNLMEDIRSFYR